MEDRYLRLSILPSRLEFQQSVEAVDPYLADSNQTIPTNRQPNPNAETKGNQCLHRVPRADRDSRASIVHTIP